MKAISALVFVLLSSIPARVVSQYPAYSGYPSSADSTPSFHEVPESSPTSDTTSTPDSDAGSDQDSDSGLTGQCKACEPCLECKKCDPCEKCGPCYRNPNYLGCDDCDVCQGCANCGDCDDCKTCISDLDSARTQAVSENQDTSSAGIVPTSAPIGLVVFLLAAGAVVVAVVNANWRRYGMGRGVDASVKLTSCAAQEQKADQVKSYGAASSSESAL